MRILRLLAGILSYIILLPWFVSFGFPATANILCYIIWIPLGGIIFPLAAIIGLIIAVPVALCISFWAAIYYLASTATELACNMLTKLIKAVIPRIETTEEATRQQRFEHRQRALRRTSSVSVAPNTPSRNDSTIGPVVGFTKDGDAISMAKHPSFAQDLAAEPPMTNSRSMSPDRAEARSIRASFIRTPEEVAKVYTHPTSAPQTSVGSSRSGSVTTPTRNHLGHHSTSFSEDSPSGDSTGSLVITSRSGNIQPISAHRRGATSNESSTALVMSSQPRRGSVIHRPSSSTASLGSVPEATTTGGNEYLDDSEMPD